MLRRCALVLAFLLCSHGTAAAQGPAPPALPTVEVTPDRAPTWRFPFDHQLDRDITVRNTGSRRANLWFEIEAHAPGERPNPILGHPQGPELELEPGETRKIRINGNFRFDYGAEDWRRPGTKTLETLVIVHHADAPHGTPPVARLVLEDRVRVLGGAGPEDAPRPNAVVTGRVTRNGRPVRGARVEASAAYSAGGLHYEARTDRRGRYRVRVRAHRQTLYRTLLPFAITATAGGARVSTVAHPQPGGSARADLRLRPPGRVRLRVVRTTRSALAPYAGDAAAGGSAFVTSPFHNESVREPEMRRRAEVRYFDGEGRLKWSFPIAREMPTIDMTGDGSRVLTARHLPDGRQSALLLDGAGRIVWETFVGTSEPERPMVATLSPDERLASVGTQDGRGMLLDVATGRVLWTVRLRNMIRMARWTADGSKVIFDSGEGVVRAFDPAEGSVIWSRELDSFSLTNALSGDRLLVGTKLGRYTWLLDTDDGSVRWRRAYQGVPDVLLFGPGRSLFFGCSTTCAVRGGLLSPSGRVRADTGQNNLFGARAATVTADGRHVVFTDGTILEIVDAAGRRVGSVRLDRPSWDGAAGYIWVSPSGDRVFIASSQTRKTYLLAGRIG